MLTRLDNNKRVHSMTGAELNCVLVRVHVTWLERRRVREGESESVRECERVVQVGHGHFDRCNI